MTNVVTVSDANGNPAFALADWNYIRGKPDNLVTSDQLPAPTDFTNYYTKQEVDELTKKSNALISPDGSTWHPVIDNNGQVKYEKEVNDA